MLAEQVVCHSAQPGGRPRRLGLVEDRVVAGLEAFDVVDLEAVLLQLLDLQLLDGVPVVSSAPHDRSFRDGAIWGHATPGMDGCCPRERAAAKPPISRGAPAVALARPARRGPVLS